MKLSKIPGTNGGEIKGIIMEKFNLEKMMEEVEEEEKIYQAKKKNLSQEDINKVFSRVKKEKTKGYQSIEQES